MKNNQNGFFQIGLLLFIPIILLSLIGIVKISLQAQASLARQSQVDLCSKKSALTFKETAKFIQGSNEKILVLQQIIYAARGLAVASAGTSMASERTALTAAKLIASTQHAKLLETDSILLQQIKCKKISYSDSPAFCRFNPMPLINEYKRSIALFPDVPGILVKRSKSWNVICAYYNKKEKTKLFMSDSYGEWQEKYEI